jgi:hypothetical protein
MGFRYTHIGKLMNEDKFAEAAEVLVNKLVQNEIATAAEENRPVAVKTNKAAVARDPDLGADYRTMSRWVSSLRDRGHDVIKQAEAKLEAHIKASTKTTQP